jgi:O-antigen/teichoic acid export membrane protein
MIAPVLRLTHDSAIYALGAVAGKGAALVLLPVLTRSLSTEEFGRFEVLSTLGTALVVALLLGLDRAALRLAFVERGEARRAMFGSWWAIATVVLLPPAVVLVAAARPISAALFGDPMYTGAVALVGVIALFNTYEVIALTALRAEQRPGAYALLSGGGLILNAALVIGLIVAFGARAELVLLAYAVSVVVAAVVGGALVRRVAMARPSRRAIRSLFALGLPLAPAVAATWAAEFADRAILLGLAGPTEVAYLGFGLRAASVAGLAVTGLQLAWEQHAYGLGTAPASLARLADDARRSMIGVALVVAAVALVAREAVLIVAGSTYLPALPAIGLCFVAIIGSALFVITTTSSMLASAMHEVGAATLVGVGVTVGGTLILAGPYGAAGVAAAIAVGQVSAAFAAGWLGRGRVAIPLAWIPTAAVLAASAAVALASTMVETPLGLRAVMGGAFALALFAEGSVGAVTGRLLRQVRG